MNSKLLITTAFLVGSLAACPFTSNTPCSSCQTSPSTCANTILAYCNSVNWADPGCDQVGVSCPFQLKSGSPCSLTVCTGSTAQQNENSCVNAIINYCSSEIRSNRLSSGYSIDPACASFTQVSTTLLSDVANTFYNASSQLSLLSNPSNGQLSISGCAKLVPDTQSFLFASATNAVSDSRCLHYYFDGVLNRFQLSYGSTTLTVACSSTFDDNAWHGVSMVLGASTVAFYVDNTLCGTATLPATRPNVCLSGDLMLGGRSPRNGPWDGFYSMVTYHEYALTTSDISRLNARCVGLDESIPKTRTVLFANTTRLPVAATQSVPLVGRRMSVTGCVRQKISNRGFILTNSESSTTDSRCLAIFSDGTLDRITVSSGGASAIISNAAAVFDDDSYHKFGVVVDGFTVTVYRDGVLYGSATLATTIPVATCPNGVTLVGARTPDNQSPFQNSVGQLEFHDSALTAAEAASVATGTTCQAPPSDGSTALTDSVIDTFSYGTVPIPAASEFTVNMCVSQFPSSVGSLIMNSLSASSSSHCFGLHSDGSSNMLWLYWNGTRQLNLQSLQDIDSGASQKLSVVISRTSFTAFLNGVFFASKPLPVPVATCPSGIVSIGGRAPGVTAPISGTVSNVLFYDYAMSISQVADWASSINCLESKTLVATQLTSQSQAVTIVPPVITAGVTSLQGCIRMAARSQTYLFSNALSATSSAVADRRYSILLDGANSRVRFFSLNTDVLITNAARNFADTNWHAVALVTEGNVASFYMDGTLYGSVALPQAVSPVFEASNFVGDRQNGVSTGLRINGAINYVKLHNFALTASLSNQTCGERAAPVPVITTLVPSTTSITTATVISTTGLNIVDNYFVSACVRMTASSQTFPLSNSANAATDNRCFSWFLSGSTRSIRLFSNGQSVSLTNSSITFDNNVMQRVMIAVEGRLVYFYVGGLLYGFTSFPVAIEPCFGTGVTYIGGRAPSGLLPISGRITDVRFGNYIDLSFASAACPASKSDEEDLIEGEFVSELKRADVVEEDLEESSGSNLVQVVGASVGALVGVAFVVVFVVRRRRTELIA